MNISLQYVTDTKEEIHISTKMLGNYLVFGSEDINPKHLQKLLSFGHNSCILARVK